MFLDILEFRIKNEKNSLGHKTIRNKRYMFLDILEFRIENEKNSLGKTPLHWHWKCCTEIKSVVSPISKEGS